MNYSRKRLIPFLWIYLISGITAAILFYGFKAAESRQHGSLAMELSEKAEETLATLVFGSRIQPYLTRISRDLKNTLRNRFVDSGKINNPHVPFLSGVFPENELWVFKNIEKNNNPQAIYYPSNSKTSRRGMTNLYSALQSQDFSTGKDKLADFLFGPGLKVASLFKRKGRPTRIIYQNRHHYLLWDTIDFKEENAGGFFLLVPDGVELAKFAMNRTAERLSSTNTTTKIHAGYLNLFSKEISTIMNKDLLNEQKLLEKLKRMAAQNSLEKLETDILPYGEKVENWQLYTRAIPHSSHLAFVFLKRAPSESWSFSFSRIIAFVYLSGGFILFLALIKCFQLPPLSLKVRFFLLFSALASIPFSMLLISAQIYLEELRVTLIRETSQKLQESISFFDKNVNNSYLLYQNEFKKLHQKTWIKEFEKMEIPVSLELDTRLKHFFTTLSPPLPWGAVVIADKEGRSITSFSSTEHKNGIEGYMKFNRIGIIEAIRNRQGLPSFAKTGKSEFITEEDITLKKAYETQTRLPVHHAFSNTHAGVTIQIAFGNLSIIRIVDYFPSEKAPLFGFSVAWNEKDLDKEFSLMAIKQWRRETPSVKFEIFRKDNEDISGLGRTHKSSDLFKTAYLTALQDRPIYLHDKIAQTIEIGIPSEKRPGIYLVGKIETMTVNKRIESIRNRFYLFLFLGMWALLFFRDALYKRLILPLLLLEKTLKTVGSGLMTRLPVTDRQDEVQSIFSSFNEMIDGVKARNRLLSLVSDSALSAACFKKNEQISYAQDQYAVSLVSDIRNFTTLCETHEPEIIISLLNHHFDQMTRIIHSCDGEIVRFVGDAIEASFQCNSGNFAEVAEKAMQASIIMLESVRIINEERQRQNLFNYKIGIGLASGMVNAFAAGQQDGRQEVLRLGKSQGLAAKLESFSKHFPDCPLVIDKSTFSLIQDSSRASDNLILHEIDQVEFYAFNKLPAVPDLAFNESAEKSSSVDNRKFKKFCESFKNARPSFFQGLLILLAPFLIILLAILTSQERSQDLIRKKAQKSNQNTINTANLNNSRREIVSLQFQKFLETNRSLIIDSLSNTKDQQHVTLKKLIQEELDFYGLKASHIILKSFNNSKDFAIQNFCATEDALANILMQGLQCFNANLNRYLLPDDESLGVFNESMSSIMFSRDARANFVQTIVASQSSWIYWQPVINNFADWKDIFEKPVSWQSQFYGVPSEDEKKRFLAGGILIVCDAPTDPASLKIRNSFTSSCYARINIKKDKIEELSGDFNSLKGFEGFASLNASEAARFLLAQAHKAFSNRSEIIIERGLSGGSDPEMHMALSSISEDLLQIKNKSRPFIILVTILLLSALLLWVLASKEIFLTRSVVRQIIGGFTGAVMIPVAGIIFILSLLHGDLKINLIEQSRENFLRKVDKVEQKMTFHRSRNPLRVKELINRSLGASFTREDISSTATSEDFHKIQQGLQNFLKKLHESLFKEMRAISLSSIMIDIQNGLSESIQVFGTLASSEDPMKKTFSHHAGRILNRLNPKISERFVHKPDPKKEIIDEMIAQQVFEILASTYGEDASLELMFGQGNPIILFGGYSNEVFYQELHPCKISPSGIVFLSFSDYYSSFFAISRILTALSRQADTKGEIRQEILAVNRVIPGMPIFPAFGEKYPAIRHAAVEYIVSGKTEYPVIIDDKEYQVFIHHSKNNPQFIFASVIELNSIDLQINSRLKSLILIVLAVFLILATLSLRISREITVPLKVLTDSMKMVKDGNYNFYLTFDREDELEEIALAFNDMQKMLAEKNILSGMVSESAAAMASSDELEQQAISGVRKEAVVLFFGIKDFDKSVSDCSTEKSKEVLNNWVSAISTRIIAAGGEVDKILEGKLLAVFFTDRASLLKSHGNSADILELALRTAISICNESPVETSCGIHAGKVIAGLMGNEKRRDHTIIGDTVNLAARCFSVSEKLADKAAIVCTESTIASLHKILNPVNLGQFSIKGKKEKLNLFRLEY